MKIAMFTNTYAPHVGGVARSVATYEEALRERGHEVIVVAPVFDNALESTDHVLRVPAIRNFNGSDFSVRIPVPGLISQHLEAFQPDIIHTHHPFLLGDAALRMAGYLRVPLVFTHHTLYEQYTHYVPLDSQAMKDFVIQLCTDFANMCDGVIAPSQSIAELLRERGVTAPITSLPTGIDVAFHGSGDRQALRQELGIGPERRVIGHLGRLAPEKNLEFLAEAVADAMSELPETEFVVVGKGSSAADIEQCFVRMGLADRLHLAGARTGQALADAYAAMDLFVFASKSETQGVVLAEAMAAGKPVIALDASGCREIVADGVNGRLLPGDATVSDFAEAIITFVGDDDAFDAAAEAARKTAQEFSVDACTTRLLDIYAERLRAARREHGESTFSTWEGLLAGVQTEWELLVQKSAAIAAATGLPLLHHDHTPATKPTPAGKP